MVTRTRIDLPPGPALRASVLLVRLAVSWNLALGIIVIIPMRFQIVMAETHGADPAAAVALDILPSIVLGGLFTVGMALQAVVILRYIRRPARDVYLLRPHLSALGWLLSTAPTLAVGHVVAGTAREPSIVTTIIWGTAGASVVLSVVFVVTGYRLRHHPCRSPEDAGAEGASA